MDIGNLYVYPTGVISCTLQHALAVLDGYYLPRLFEKAAVYLCIPCRRLIRRPAVYAGVQSSPGVPRRSVPYGPDRFLSQREGRGLCRSYVIARLYDAAAFLRQR